MLSSVLKRCAGRTHIRAYASLSNVPATSIAQPNPPPSSAPVAPRRTPVDPDHGLYSFFRKKIDSNGAVRYETAEVVDPSSFTGRSWKAEELRLKSFKDLHTLWYVLLRERNLLATQSEQVRRIVGNQQATDRRQALMVRKSMARIKYVLNERRLAYEGAVDLVAAEKARALEERWDQEVHEHQLRIYNQERSRQAREVATKGTLAQRRLWTQRKARRERAEKFRALREAKQIVRAKAIAAAREKMQQEESLKAEEVKKNQEKKEVERQKEARRTPEGKATAGVFGRGR